MAFLAKYLEFDGPTDLLRASLSPIVGRLSETDNVPHGYHGMDHYWSFSVGSLLGEVMVKEASDRLSVVVFTMPSMLQKSKARGLLDQVASTPNAQAHPFPGGKGGLLTFV
ncbi:hypothetical protein [Nocardioides pacificus]